jgi:hypothetical protein
MVLGAVITGLEEAINRMSGSNDRLHRLPAWWRDFYFSVPLDEDRWIVLPIGWLAGGFRSLVRRGYEKAEGINEGAWDGFGGALFERFSPITEPSQLGGPVGITNQIAYNYNDFTDQSLVPDWELTEPVAQREGARVASRLGKVTRKLLDPVLSEYALDPRTIDFFIEQTFGITGQMATSFSDVGRTDRPGTIGKHVSLGLVRRTPGSSAVMERVVERARKAGEYGKREFRKLRELRTAIFAERDPKKRASLIRRADVEAQILERSGVLR